MATFSITLLQSINVTMRETQALILSPTQEQAIQTQAIVHVMGSYMHMQCLACIGGTSFSEDTCKLKDGQHIISGTPGWVFNMIQWQHMIQCTSLSQLAHLHF